MTVWQWDPSLYLGSADYYAAGRMPYPSSVVWALRDTLGLDGTGRLLDVGSGPGTLTIPLAGLFAGSVAVDADADMIAAGRASAESLGLRSISWQALRAEELPADLGRFRVITFAQSFHWMDQPRVARTVAGMLEEGGSVVHLGATTDKGTGATPRTSLPYPKPPWDEINELVRDYLGTRKRAGQGVRPTASFGTEREVFSAAGFGEPQTVEVPHNVARIRTVKEIVAAVYSLSYSAPHLFGDRKDEFEAELRALLASRSALGGLFAEQVGSVQLTFWRAPEGGVVAPSASPSRESAGSKASAAKTSTAKTAAGKRSAGKRSSAKAPSAKRSSTKASPTKTSPAETSPANESPSKTSPAKAAAGKPATGKTATKSAATETSTGQPAARSARKSSSAKTPRAMNPSVARTPIAVTTTAPSRPRASAKRSAPKTPAATSSATSAAKSTATRRSAAQTSPAKTSVTKTLAVKTSAVKTSAAKTPVAKTSAAKTPVAKTSAAKTSVAPSSVAQPSASKSPATNSSASQPAVPTPRPKGRRVTKKAVES